MPIIADVFFFVIPLSRMAGVGEAPLWLQRAALRESTELRQRARKKVLVAIFQRGAADGLNIVVPHGEKRYYDLRPTISVPRPAANVDEEDSAIDLDGFFGCIRRLLR